MLVTFRFKNFGPFKEEAVFDMRAVKSYKEHPYNLITDYEDIPLLKVAAVYGANASGKSNFVEAYSAFSYIVNRSFQMNNGTEEDAVLETCYNPFLFSPDSAAGSTEYEAVFLCGNAELKYGFIHDDKQIQYEWLYRTDLSTKRSSIILEREGADIDLGDSIKKSCGKYLADIDSDVLALSFFGSLKLKTTVFRQTIGCIQTFLPISLSRDRIADRLLQRYWERDFNEEEKAKLLSFLRGIDVGIRDIEVEKNGKKVVVYTYHRGCNDGRCRMLLDLESDGTRRAIALYSVFRIAARFGKGLLIDEFHSQLHPLLQKYLVDLFCEESKTGQLIYTTHDTSLLDKKYMRRDQIWFVDKDEEGVSSLYSLADFKVRNDASFEKDYLGGIYGGIPNLKDFSFGED